MKKSIKKTVVTLMAAAVITSSAVAAPLSKPVTVDAAVQSKVTKSDILLRQDPYKSSKVVTRIPKNTHVSILSRVKNNYGNIWYYVGYVDICGKYYKGYIYSANLH